MDTEPIKDLLKIFFGIRYYELKICYNALQI